MIGVGKYDEEKIMLLEMSKGLNKPVEEIIKDAIRINYEAFKFCEPLQKLLEKYDLFRTEKEYEDDLH